MNLRTLGCFGSSFPKRWHALILHGSADGKGYTTTESEVHGCGTSVHVVGVSEVRQDSTRLLKLD